MCCQQNVKKRQEYICDSAESNTTPVYINYNLYTVCISVYCTASSVFVQKLVKCWYEESACKENAKVQTAEPQVSLF